MRGFGVGLVLSAWGVSVAVAQRSTREGVLHDSAGKEVGQVILRDNSRTMGFRIAVRGLPPGIHGVHIHEVGKCEPPGFQTAGPHYNPHHRQHGRKNPQGPHLGDLGNLTVGADGRGTRTVNVSDSETRKGLDAFLGDGRAIVIHAAADDERTDPTGNSGPRIACAVVK
jgi:Cu-Zn family superoxide dismutase